MIAPVSVDVGDDRRRRQASRVLCFCRDEHALRCASHAAGLVIYHGARPGTAGPDRRAPAGKAVHSGLVGRRNGAPYTLPGGLVTKTPPVAVLSPHRTARVGVRTSSVHSRYLAAGRGKKR